MKYIRQWIFVHKLKKSFSHNAGSLQDAKSSLKFECITNRVSLYRISSCSSILWSAVQVFALASRWGDTEWKWTMSLNKLKILENSCNSNLLTLLSSHTHKGKKEENKTTKYYHLGEPTWRYLDCLTRKIFSLEHIAQVNWLWYSFIMFLFSTSKTHRKGSSRTLTHIRKLAFKT